MKTNAYSRTAEYMAVCRAIEYTGRSAPKRILSDPWAIRFIPSKFWRALACCPLASRLLARVFGMWVPGAVEYALARARLVDDLTRSLAGQGLEQLVLLGAGFDTTLFRLQDSLRDVQVFEVDHPDTQTVKKAALAKTGVPGKALFLPVDFEKDNFVRRLIDADFDRRRRSLVTWLGVSYYLSPAAVDLTLSQVAELTSPGSWLIFDYAVDSVLEGKGPCRAARSGVAHAARLGEPFLCGFDPGAVAGHMAESGFQLLSQYGRSELQKFYCEPGRVPVDFLRIALCQTEAQNSCPPSSAIRDTPCEAAF